MPRNRTFLGLKVYFNGSCSENHLCFLQLYGSVLLSMANIVLPYFGRGKNETLTKDAWKNGCQLRYMEEDVNMVILHMGIHMMWLYILVTIHLDLENKDVHCLAHICLSVSFNGKYFTLSIMCALILWVDSCGLLILRDLHARMRISSLQSF